jgi:peptidyl-prolyl cis-trans isomerase SDCCAG10
MEANLRKMSRRRSGSPESADEQDAKRRKGPSVLEAELAGYTRGRSAKGKGKGKNEDDVLAALGLFSKKLSGAPKEKASTFTGDSADAPNDNDGDVQADEGLDVDDDLGWMSHKLVEVRTDRDAEVTRRAEADYEVRPLLCPTPHPTALIG